MLSYKLIGNRPNWLFSFWREFCNICWRYQREPSELVFNQVNDLFSVECSSLNILCIKERTGILLDIKLWTLEVKTVKTKHNHESCNIFPLLNRCGESFGQRVGLYAGKYEPCVLITLLISSSPFSHAKPMGWMSWERFRCITDCKKYPKECISENLIMEHADAMVNEGFVDLPWFAGK